MLEENIEDESTYQLLETTTEVQQEGELELDREATQVQLLNQEHTQMVEFTLQKLKENQNLEEWRCRNSKVDSSEETQMSENQNILDNNTDKECSSDIKQESASERNNTSGIQDKLLKLKLGRGRGRPRKMSRITNFFDFALKNRNSCRSSIIRLENTSGNRSQEDKHLQKTH